MKHGKQSVVRNTQYLMDARCRTDNLFLNMMTPGPTEPTSAQLQNYLKGTVDDLLMLYDEGIVVKTAEHPNGRSVCSTQDIDNSLGCYRNPGSCGPSRNNCRPSCDV